MTGSNHNCVDDNKLQEDIQKFGWTVLLVEATNYLPSFAYTVGLWKNYKRPEIISFGLSTKTLHLILNDAGETFKNGKTLEVGKKYSDFFENGRAEFINVDKDNYSDYFGYAIDYYKSVDFPALQLIWTDRNDKFPWDNDYSEEFRFMQPLLDRNMDFKFLEERNLGIFTTRQWLELDKPILRVVHDEDGDWQFLTGDQMPEDIKLVSLEEMIKRDKTLNEIFNLDYGEEADREVIGGRWTRRESEKGSS